MPTVSLYNIVWRGPVSLVPGILRLSGSDVDGLGSVQAVSYLGLPPYLDWHMAD